MDDSSKSIAHSMTVLLGIASLLLAAGYVKNKKSEAKYFVDK